MKYSLALLAALLSVVSSFPTPLKVEIPPQCADPTYACQDLRSARECGVVKSCINDIWSTMSAPDDNNEICDLCKEMVKEARDQLLSNMTQEEIKEVFEGSCKLFPVKLVADACIKLVDEFIPELVETLSSEMDPTMVCSVAGLCNVAHLPIQNRAIPVLLRMVISSLNDDKCKQCTSLVEQIKEFVSSETEADLKNMVLNFCDKEVSSIICKELVNMYFSQVYQYIITADPESVCESVGVCPGKSPHLKENTNNLKDNLTCEFCEGVLEHIKQMIIANTTEEEFRTALLNFCKVLGSFSNECTNIVNDYFDMMYDYIRNLDTKGVCTFLGLCDSGEKIQPGQNINRLISMTKILPAFPNTENSDIHPLVKILPAEALSKKDMKISNADSNDIFDTSSNNQLPINRLSHPIITFERDTECAFCRAIAFYLKTDLNGDRSKNGIKHALDNVCDKWVKEYPEHCQTFVQKYSQKVLYEIALNNDFDTLCSNVKACPLENKNTVSVKVIPPAPESDDNVVCDLCKEVLNTVEQQLKDPSTKESIKQCLDNVCNIVPASLKEKCQEFIKDNIDILFTVLTQELNPDSACPALRLCPKSGKASVPTIVKDIECDLCKELVQQLQTELQNPQTKESLKEVLEKGCSILPQSLAVDCKNFVDNNIDAIINMLVEELDPVTVCSALNICPGTLKKLISPVSNELECDLCKEIIQEVENELKDQKTEEAIREALDKVCSILPSSIAKKCQNFVDTYANLIITLLAQEMDPSMVCAALNVCPANLQHLREWHSKAADIECNSCQYLISFVQQQLMNSNIQAEVKNFLKEICARLPESFGQNCDAFVDEYGSALLTLIAQELDPNSTCSELGMCPANSIVVQKLPDPMAVRSLDLDECSVCKTVVDYLDKLLEQDDVDREITSLIEKVCTVVPASVREKCTGIIEAYGPYLLQMIGQLADSNQVCQDIDLCARPAGHVHLLGGEKCTFGPTYWCKSNAHATACKAMTYCTEKVWEN